MVTDPRNDTPGPEVSALHIVAHGRVEGGRSPVVWQAQRTFDNTDHAPIEVRRFVGECLAAWGVTEVDGRIILAVSELTTNAVVHGSGPIDVTMEANSDRLRVTVSDQGDGIPTLHHPDQGAGDPGGWGLHLVDTLVDDWGTERQQQRTIVWFERGLPAD